ncbi:MAG: RNA polymerase sigma factor [Clostridiales bacterium]|nr:RNA polymerase sigma factor [Clostridiales bacterium]
MRMDFEAVYARYFRKVYSFVLSLTRNAHTAEEITQETFFRMLKNPDAFKGQSSVDTYLCSIAHNLYISSIRKQKKQAFDVDLEFLPDQKHFESIFLDRDTARQIHYMLHRLEEPYKEVFTLRVFGELPFSEIGALFEKGDGWARVIFYRAKQQLQEALKEE